MMGTGSCRRSRVRSLGMYMVKTIFKENRILWIFARWF